MDACAIEFTAVGFKFRKGDDNKSLTPECLKESGFIGLRPEPDNKYDTNAVKVLMNGKHVGYVARDYCKGVLKILNSECRTRVKLLETYEASANLLLLWTSID